MRLLLTCVGVVIFAMLAGCWLSDNGAEQADTPPQPADVAKDYKKLKLMTPSPVFVNPELAMLCRGAPKQAVEEARKKAGIHAHTMVRIYMSDAAAETFKARSSGPKSKPVYPVGSIIIKEKTGEPYDDFTDHPARTHDGVGGMIKRPVGYDPEHGDWEYFYFEDVSKIESGRISSCVQCHAGAADCDHVFGSWSKGSARGSTPDSDS